jgi:hypothetical protein
MYVRAASLLALALAAPALATPPSDGPLGVGTPGAFRGLFLEMPLADARGAGAVALDVRWWMANDWSVPTRLTRGDRAVWVQDDAQSDVLQLSVTVPWSRWLAGPGFARVESTAVLRLTERWGGWSDAGIEQWHALIGSWNFQREFYRRNAVGVTLEEEGGPSLVRLQHPAPALSDLVLRTGVRLAEGAPRDGRVPWAVALRGDVKLPTGLGPLGGSGGVDGGLGLAVAWAPSPHLTAHGLASLRAVSPLPHGFPLRVRPLQAGLDLSVVVRVRGPVALVLEDRLSSPLFEGGWSLGAVKEPEATAYYALFLAHNQISGGVRVGELTAFFCEDFTPGRRISGDPGPNWFYNSNEPDVVLGVSWARSF